MINLMLFSIGYSTAISASSSHSSWELSGLENESYCGTTVQHLGIPAETASAVVLTIQNVDANSMIVSITSADDDPVDVLVVPAASGAMIGPEDTSVPGEISRTLTWDTPPAEVMLNVLWSKESFGGNWQLSPDDVTVNFNEACDGSVSITLPVDFEQAPENYSFVGFEGADSAIEANPDQSGENTSANVMRTIKTEGAAFFAGTAVDLDSPINFDNGTVISISSWSPTADIPVRIALENQETGNQVFVDVNTTVANTWETLEADFAGNFNPDISYDKVIVFFEFIVDLPGDGSTYFFDNIAQSEGDGGGGDDPNVYCSTEVQHLGIPAETASAIVLTIENVDANSMLVTITSADDDPVDVLVIPAASGAAIGPEDTSVPGEISRTLTWDMPPAEVMLNVLWSKESFGGNWQLSPTDVTVNFNQMCDGGGEGVVLPLDFELPAEEYSFDFFGGAVSEIIANPDQSGINESATVMQTVKTAGAEVFAGTFVDLDQPIDFSQTSIINVDTWVPAAGVTVRIALESAGGGNQIAVDVPTTASSTWETLSANFAGLINPDVDYGRVVVIFDFGNPGDDATYYYDNVDTFIDMTEQVELPLDFELPLEEYTFEGFEGAASAIEANPDQSGVNTSATVMRTIKTEGAAFFAGTFVNLDVPVDFSENSAIKMDVWSPKLDIPVRLQLENADNTVNVNLDVNTTTTNEWETLTFDFTGMLPQGASFVRVVVFFEFVDGLAGDGSTYYFDNVEVTQGEEPELVFCETTVTHLGIPAETASAIKLTIENLDANSMIVTISSFTNSPVDALIVANGSGATISDEDFSVEGEISRTLTWADPPEEVTLNVLWSNEAFEGNWQLSPEEITVPFTISCDDVLAQVDLPVTFEDQGVDYSFGDFEGTASTVVVDPTDPENTVAQTIRTEAAGIFAGTVIGVDGFASVIPFAPPLDTKISVRVWSPEAGIPVRMKVENAFNPGIFVETETSTTVAMEWETLEFDFNASIGPPINFSQSYSKAILFFNFGAEGSVVGEQTFYWDDVQFVPGADLEQVDLPVTFEDENVAYLLTDFAGTFSTIVEDPVQPSNTVAQTVRGGGSEVFAGTTIGGAAGFANEIPFEEGSTLMNVRVWSPDAGIPVRLKVENQGNPGQSVETETTVTVAEGWQTLEFDFSDEVDGTAPINFDFVYSKATIFFNFGAEPGTVEDQTFYWDNLQFGAAPEPFTVYDIIADSDDHETLEFALGEAELVDALNGTGPFTVFAPTDAAFDALPDGMLDMLLEDPTGDLQEILLYHVLGQQVPSANIVEGPVTSLQGEDIMITIEGEDVFVNEVLVSVVDLFADNGVVHVIDAVILPPSFSEGLEELSSVHSIKAWPNPAVDQLNVEFLLEDYMEAQLTVYDISGRLIEQLNPQNKLSRIDLSDYDAGQYILRIDTENAGYFHKFVITK
jgi:flagellin-like hook-associated protein FlgL